jgi:outer membrane beta-barrel protein
MNDAFFSKALVGARVAYHLTEAWSVGVNGSYAFSNSATGSTNVCTSNAGCRPATDAELYQVPGHLKYIVGAEVAFAPVYAKLNVFAEKAIHLDLALLAGADLVGYRDVLDATSANGGAQPADATSPGGHVGVATRVFLGPSVALGLEVKDVLYSVKGLSTGKLQNQLLAQAGLSFFLPLRHEAQ